MSPDKPTSIKLDAINEETETPKEPKLKLNVGCGEVIIDGWINIDYDIHAAPNADRYFDITGQQWPYANDSVDEIIIAHVLEHLTTPDFFHVIKELYRVAKPGAIIRFVTPHPRHNVYLNDPTHQHPVTPDTLAMFSQDACAQMYEKQGGRLTPFWKIAHVDFDFHGDLHMVLDPGVPESVQKDGSWKELERTHGNIVVEYRWSMTATKPWTDKSRVPAAERINDTN